jgi:hypothetical protein
LLISCCQIERATGAEQFTPDGWSLTWTLIADNLYNSNVHRIRVHAAKTTVAPGAAALSIAGGLSTHTGCEASLVQVLGADVSGTAAQAIVQSVTATGAGTTGTVTLAAATAAANRPLAIFGHVHAEAITPRTNWTELDDQNHATPDAASETQYRGDAFETTCTATWASSGNWAGTAMEIKAAAADSVGFIPI